jgi:hypothetical protein
MRTINKQAENVFRPKYGQFPLLLVVIFLLRSSTEAEESTSIFKLSDTTRKGEIYFLVLKT